MNRVNSFPFPSIATHELMIHGLQVSPFTIPALLGNTAAGVIAIETGARGPNFGLVSACATATHCIGEALQAIREGEVRNPCVYAIIVKALDVVEVSEEKEPQVAEMLVFPFAHILGRERERERDLLNYDGVAVYVLDTSSLSNEFLIG